MQESEDGAERFTQASSVVYALCHLTSERRDAPHVAVISLPVGSLLARRCGRNGP